MIPTINSNVISSIRPNIFYDNGNKGGKGRAISVVISPFDGVPVAELMFPITISSIIMMMTHQ
jgi:hypothetical protein